MGLACLSLPIRDPMEAFMDMVEKAARKWAYDQRHLVEEKKTPSLYALSEQLGGASRELLGALLKGVVEQRLGGLLHQAFAHCPHCERRLRRKRFEPKRVSTLQGAFTLERPYFYCPECRYGFCPLDQALELAPQVHQFDLQHRVARMAARVPFEEAVAAVEELTGIGVSNHFAHDTLSAVGEAATLDLVIPSREEIDARIAKARGASRIKPILVVAADGAKTPTRPKAARKGKRGPGRYREVRGVRIYLLDAEDEVIPVASWHQIETAEAFRADLEVIAGRIAHDQVRISLVADGADWVWKAMVGCFPSGRQILDFYHCIEHLYAVARVQYGEGSLEGHQWVESTMVRLSEGQVELVIEQLRRLRPRQSEAAREETRKLVGYLTGQRKRIRYVDDIERGYPIGSGAIESANKFLCHSRMKRSGAWWVEESGNAMLRVRCAMYNGTYDRVFEHYRALHRPTAVPPTTVRDE